MTRRDFIGASAVLAITPIGLAIGGAQKKRLVLAGTGIRGINFWFDDGQ